MIYGDSGLGKTHLIYSIAHVIQKNDRNAKIAYVKGDDLTNELVNAIREGKTAEMREKYRKADLLLVDDVQFIAGRKQTQEEFFHTFNNLYESGKQIVLTSDRPPSEMMQLEDRLRTRFEWGLLVDVAPPDYETRLAIIKNKAALLGMEIPNKVAVYIAERVTSNVRQLEGTINKLLAYKDLLGDDVDEELVKRAIQDILRRGDNIPTPDSIVEFVSKYYGVDAEVIRGQQRVREAVNARQVAMYIGSTSSSGLHHLVYEIVDNAIDEALAGYCTEILVQINADGTITVVDNGRGIPVDIQAQTGRPALEVVFSVLHAGGKFGGGGYKVSGGLHGVGASVVNALSEWLVVQVHKDGQIYEMKFSRGAITQEIKVVGTSDYMTLDPVIVKSMGVRQGQQPFPQVGIQGGLFVGLDPATLLPAPCPALGKTVNDVF